jgi:endonuclease/exonuclease/phosphatase family metal-dependent hydrolase
MIVATDPLAESGLRTASGRGGSRTSRGRRTRRLLLAAAIALLVVLAGYQRQPCGANAGTQFEGEIAAAPASNRRLRVGTLNMHGGKGSDGRLDLARTAQLLDGLDLAALNEVRGTFAWERVGQAEQLGRKLGLKWLFAPTEERWWHYRFGNSVLSSLEVSSWQTIPLRREASHTYRNAVLLSARHGDASLHLVITHLERGDEQEREHQLRTVADLFLALSEPAILLGDLNCTADDDELRRLLSQPGVRDPLADVLGAAAPPRIDWILTRGLRTLDAGLLDNGASDHPLVWAELELPNP